MKNRLSKLTIFNLAKADQVYRLMPRVGFLLGFLLAGLFLFFSQAMAIVPELPTEWRSAAKNNKYLLLDFYSDYCGTCKMMEPHLRQMQSQLSNQLNIKHINISKEPVSKAVEAYEISGTPTFILYQSNGQPVYRMTELISPMVLNHQIRRVLGTLSPVSIPSDVELPHAKTGQEKSWKNLILLSFETSDCVECKAIRPQLDSFAYAGQDDGLHIIHIDAATSPLWTYNLGLRTFPTYLLLDNAVSSSGKHEYGELFRVTGKTDPALLWQAIQMYGKSGV
jgi:thioredoxin 1